jgi:hypothetical protein
MNKRWLILAIALMQSGLTWAADPPWDVSDQISVEELAHYFFSTPSAADRVKGSVVSEDAAKTIRDASATHWRTAHGAKELAIEARQLCKDLRNARTGADFAAALGQSNARERERAIQGARRILNSLALHDRQELESWLNTVYRRGFKGGGFATYVAEHFGSRPFPSETTDGITRETCAAAAEFEKRAQS